MVRILYIAYKFCMFMTRKRAKSKSRIKTKKRVKTEKKKKSNSSKKGRTQIKRKHSKKSRRKMKNDTQDDKKYTQDEIIRELQELGGGDIIPGEKNNNPQGAELFSEGKESDDKKSNLRVKKGSLVRIDYSLTTSDGIIVDTSLGFEADNCGILDADRDYKPIEIIVGNKEIIKGIDKALLGMRESESKTIVIKPKDGFGVYDKSKLKKLSMNLLEINHKPIVGESIALAKDGEAELGIIRKVGFNSILVDFNHPLAGKTLICSLKVLKIYK